MTDKSGTAVALSGATRIKLALSVSASIRANLALNQLQAARRFALQCGETETANLGQPLGPFFDTIRDSVIASVILSVLSFEANINEHFVAPEVKDTFVGLSNEACEKLVELMENASILAKYQHVLDVRGKPRFDHGSQPYQDTQLLVKLRNALVHFKPEWDNEQNEHAKLGTQLDGKFEPSPFLGSHETMFPRRFLSYDCARWSVQTALRFVRAFPKQADFSSESLLNRFADEASFELPARCSTPCVHHYPSIIEGDAETGYSVFFPDLPGCTSGGDTLQETALNAEEGLAAHIALMLDAGEPVPSPSRLDDLPRPIEPDVVEVSRLLVRMDVRENAPA